MISQFLKLSDKIYLTVENLNSIALPLLLSDKNIIYSINQKKLELCQEKLKNFTNIIEIEDDKIINKILNIKYKFINDINLIKSKDYIEIL